MNRFISFILCLGGLFLIIGCTDGKMAGTSKTEAEKVEVLISAAASLTEALTEVKSLYEEKNEGVTLTFHFGSSGKLATQIGQGAPSDVFLSASKKDMDSMQEQGLIVEDSRVDLAGNALVLITNADSTLDVTSFEDIDSSKIKHIAVGEPESVPVGRYTKEVFEYLGLWKPLKNRIVLSSDVRQVLTHVEMGNADLGMVYASDAFISDKVKVLSEANPDWHTPIVYPGAVLTDSKHQDASQAFLTYLTNAAAKEIMQKYGFTFTQW